MKLHVVKIIDWEKSKETWTARKPESTLSAILGLFPNKTKKRKEKK